MVKLDVILNGISHSEPVEWRDLEVLATFDNEAVQANISIEQITLVGAAAKAANDWVEAGLTGGPGIFEGMPIQWVISDGINVPRVIFDGYIDFTQSFKIFKTRWFQFWKPWKVQCKMVKRKGLNDLETKLSALTYGLLLDKGAIVNADFVTVKTLTIKYDQGLENLMLALVEFEMIRELYFLTLKIASDASNLPLPGAIISLVLDAAYAALLVVQIIKIGKKLIDVLFALPVENKAITYYTALSKACAYLGYGFTTSITDMKYMAYLPSKPDETDTTTGIPQSQDFGYRCSEMFEIAMKLFDAKIAVVGGTVQMHSRFNPYWTNKLATFPVPTGIPLNVLNEVTEYNTDEYKGTRIISFLTDTQDEWTIKNFTGTNYEIITEPVVKVDSFNVLNKGLEEINIPTALGNVNDRFEGYETFLIAILTEIDKILLKFGSNTVIMPNLVAHLGTSTGSPLKVSTRSWSVPKTLYLTKTFDGTIVKRQRDAISAKYLWNTYYSASRSFLPANKYGQKLIVNDVKIPFGYLNFVQTISNAYFAGGGGKMVSIKWKFDSDYAIASWWTPQVYTNNLKETKIEP